VKPSLAAAALTVAAVLAATPANAEPDPAGRFDTRTPNMLCQLDRDGTLWCQGTFPDAPTAPCGSPLCPDPPLRWDQAVISPQGRFRYADGNIGVGDGPLLDTLGPGRTWHFRGWTMSAGDGAVTFTADATGHGMTIAADGQVAAR
jgi:hypothetical protein